jgi:uncharacterized protein YbaR (Trm112 family)
MKHSSLELLICPSCHGQLEITCSDPDAELCLTGNLCCVTCSKNYNLIDGIPHFIQAEQLSGLNRRFSRMYDWFSWGYRAFSRIAFAFIGTDEETGRREITDRLEPHGGWVLEVSIGRCELAVSRPTSRCGEVIGLDISLGQSCAARVISARRA